MTSTPTKIADAVWIALASLHQRQEYRESFTTAEVRAEVLRLKPDIKPQTLAAHISSHLVANAKPDGGHYRMLMRLDDNLRRLYRPDDRSHPERHGKTKPKRDEIPTEYWDLLDWYEEKYCRRTPTLAPDFAAQMWGLGREIWADTDADSYVESLRSGW